MLRNATQTTWSLKCSWRGVAFAILVINCLLVTSLARAQAPTDAEKITYTDHILPLVRRRCGTCHNSTDRKGGLALDSYSSALAGGSSGPSLAGGDLGSSYLWSLVNRESEPYMPPMSDKLPDAELSLIRRWIEQGLRENSGSEAKMAKRSEIGQIVVTGKRPEIVAMPEGYLGVAPRTTPRPNAITALAVSPWAPLLAVSGHQQVALYHTLTRELLAVLPFPEGQPQILKFSRDGSLLLVGGGRGGAEGKVVLFDVKTGQRKAELGQEFDAVLAADISPDLARVALGGPKKMLRVFSTSSGELLYQTDKHTDWITAVEFSPDGVLLASGDRSNGLAVWETVSGRPYQDLVGHKGAITDVTWRPDSNILASASEDGTIKLWEMNEGTQARNTAAKGAVLSLEYTRDGRLVSTGRGKVVQVWSPDGKALAELGPLEDLGLEAAFDNENNLAIVGDWTGTVRIWDLKDGKESGRVSTNPPALEALLADVEQRLAKLDPASAEEGAPIPPEVVQLRVRLAGLKAAQSAVGP